MKGEQAVALGALLKQFRLSRKLTQLQVERRSVYHITRSTLGHYECGRRCPPPEALLSLGACYKLNDAEKVELCEVAAQYRDKYEYLAGLEDPWAALGQQAMVLGKLRESIV